MKNGERYYYDDPLAAAWMTKHFGLKLFVPQHRWFAGQDWANFILTEAGLCHEVINEAKCNGRNPLYFIHHESVQLLEPRHGDLVEYIDGVHKFGHYDGNSFRTVNKIIHRDGIAFHWPQPEE